MFVLDSKAFNIQGVWNVILYSFALNKDEKMSRNIIYRIFYCDGFFYIFYESNNVKTKHILLRQYIKILFRYFEKEFQESMT